MTSPAVKPPPLISHRRTAFTQPRPRGRFRAFTLPKLRGRFRAFTLPKPRGRSSAFTLPKPRGRPSAFTLVELRGRPSAFTLVEMLVVIVIIALLMVLVAPAFTSLKGAGDVTNAAYAIKGVLEQARTTAMASNTYSWVGFYEEDASVPSANPPIPGNGRLIISIVASTDGTNVYGSNTSGPIDPTKLRQIGKLVKIDNIHLPLFAIGTGAGETFETRPALQQDPPPADYNYSRFGELNAAAPNTAPYTTPFNFQYPVGNPAPTAQYTFKKLLQFSPLGEARVSGKTYNIRHFVEVGLIQTHGSAVPAPTSGAGTSTATYAGNVVALQITGFGGNVKIYRR